MAQKKRKTWAIEKKITGMAQKKRKIWATEKKTAHMAQKKPGIWATEEKTTDMAQKQPSHNKQSRSHPPRLSQTLNPSLHIFSDQIKWSITNLQQKCVELLQVKFFTQFFLRIGF